MAADVEEYRRFNPLDAERAQKRFAEALLRARQHAGVREQHVVVQSAGDGQFTIFPVGLDGSLAIPKLVEGLRLALRETNRELSAHARIRLRTSLYRGHVSRGPNGWVGYATIAVHRLLNSAVAREALKTESSADFILVVSGEIHRDYMLNQQGWMRPEDLIQVVVDVPTKQFTEHAWVYVPRR